MEALVDRWLAERTVPVGPPTFTSLTDLFADYRAFAGESAAPHSADRLSNALQGRGYRSQHRRPLYRSEFIEVFEIALTENAIARAPIHTPGPWSAEGPDEVFGDFNIHESGLRAAVAAVVSNLRPPKVVEANARLCAAAPELLGALKYVLPLIVGMEDRIDRATTETPWGKVAEHAVRAAIAKAEGKA